MVKFAIADTYGITTLRGPLSYVKRIYRGFSYYTTTAGDAILFDTKEAALKFATKKGLKVADHYVRNSMYVQELDDDLLYNGYSLRDNGTNQLEKINLQQLNNEWLTAKGVI